MCVKLVSNLLRAHFGYRNSSYGYEKQFYGRPELTSLNTLDDQFFESW
jgi:hypothetical protein